MKYWINQWDKSDECYCYKCREPEIKEATHKKCNCHDKKKDDWDKKYNWDKKDNCKWISCGDVNIFVDCKNEKEHDWDKNDNCKRIKCGDVNIYIVCKDNKRHDWDHKCDCHE